MKDNLTQSTFNIKADVEENITNWKSYNEEQKFLLYQVQCLKEGGLGACTVQNTL